MPGALPAQGCGGQGAEHSPGRALPCPAGVELGVRAVLRQLWALEIGAVGLPASRKTEGKNPSLFLGTVTAGATFQDIPVQVSANLQPDCESAGSRTAREARSNAQLGLQPGFLC